MVNYDTTNFSTGKKGNVGEAAAALVTELDTLDSTTETVKFIKIQREGVNFTGTLIHLET